MPTPIEISSKRCKLHVGASMTQTCDGEMAIRCVSTWQIIDSNYAIVKVLFKPDVRMTLYAGFYIWVAVVCECKHTT
jgi:hypothetical protein